LINCRIFSGSDIIALVEVYNESALSNPTVPGDADES